MLERKLDQTHKEDALSVSKNKKES